MELPERAYGTDCKLFDPSSGILWDNIRDTVLDEFVLAHIFGWFAKALMIRNHFLLWVLSISFETMELTFQVGSSLRCMTFLHHHMVPESWRMNMYLKKLDFVSYRIAVNLLENKPAGTIDKSYSCLFAMV